MASPGSTRAAPPPGVLLLAGLLIGVLLVVLALFVGMFGMMGSGMGGGMMDGQTAGPTMTGWLIPIVILVAGVALVAWALLRSWGGRAEVPGPPVTGPAPARIPDRMKTDRPEPGSDDANGSNRADVTDRAAPAASAVRAGAPERGSDAEALLVRLLEADERRLFLEIREKGGKDGAVHQKEIGHRDGFSRAKVTRVLDKLEGRGLVVRERDGMTNRVRIVRDGMAPGTAGTAGSPRSGPGAGAGGS